MNPTDNVFAVAVAVAVKAVEVDLPEPLIGFQNHFSDGL